MKLQKNLIMAGADINDRDIYGRTILMKINTQSKRYLDFVTFVLSRPEVDIRIIDRNGWDAFFLCAVEHCRIEMVRMLLEKGANVNRKTRYELNALAYTTSYNVIQLLITAGIDINAVDEDRVPMVVHMIENDAPSSYNWLELLIDSGLDTSYIDPKTGNNLLHKVATSVNDWCKILIEKKQIHIDSKNNNALGHPI